MQYFYLTFVAYPQKESLVWLLVTILERLFCTTQLGGKNAGIVFEDADLGKCIPTMIRWVGVA